MPVQDNVDLILIKANASVVFVRRLAFVLVAVSFARLDANWIRPQAHLRVLQVQEAKVHRHLGQLVLQREHIDKLALPSHDPAEGFLYYLLVISLLPLAFVEYCQCVDAVFYHFCLLGVHVKILIIVLSCAIDINTSDWVHRCRVATFLAAAFN